MKQVLFGVAFALAATGSVISAQLSDEYQEVESLTARYGQYVDTDYAVKTNSEFRFRFAIARTAQTSAYRAAFGTYTAEDTKCTRIICNNTSATSLLVYFNCIAGKDGTTFGGVTAAEDQVIAGYMNASKAKLNNVELSLKASSSGPDDGKKLFLFAAGAGQSPMKVTIYSFSVLEGGKTVHDYVPCYRKRDLKTGMYDVKTGDFRPVSFGTHASAKAVEQRFQEGGASSASPPPPRPLEVLLPVPG